MAIPVPITGEVLRWARAEAGVSVRQMAADLGVSMGTVEAWEEEVEEPTATQFHKISGLLGRPESFFFLPHPPTRSPVVAAFRRTRGAEAHLSAQEVKAVRQAKNAAKVVAWIRRREHDGYRVAIPKAITTESPTIAADLLREWLGWPKGTFVGTGSTAAGARNRVRSDFQNHGILAFHFSLVESPVRGFALPDVAAPVVAVNTGDADGARLFSYAHELAHLALGDRSVCHTRENQGVERWCNQVAGALLMPAAEFRKNVSEKLRVRKVEDIAQVRTLANYYGLSLRAIAVRLDDLSLAMPGLYALVDQSTEKKKHGGTANPDRLQTKPRIKVQQLGRAYGSAILDADELGILTRAQVLELVALSPTEYTEYRAILLSGDEG